jgi:hypothetical protein
VRPLRNLFLLVMVGAFLLGVWSVHRPPADRGQRRPPSGPPFHTAAAARTHDVRPASRLISVRTSRQDGFDRVEFAFDRALPGWRVAYVPVLLDGAGRRLPLQGRAVLGLTFRPALARDPGGGPSFAPQSVTPAYDSLRQVRLAGDLEGRVRLGLGVRDHGGFRVLESSRPPRIIVDLRT